MTYRTANLQICILYIYSTNISTEYFKRDIYSPCFPLQNAVCFIILLYLVPVLFTFYIQSVLKLKKNNFGYERLISFAVTIYIPSLWYSVYFCNNGVHIFFNCVHPKLFLHNYIKHVQLLSIQTHCYKQTKFCCIFEHILNITALHFLSRH